MFALKYFTLVAFLPLINAKITDQEIKDMFKIFVDTVNFSEGSGKAVGIIKPLPEKKDLNNASARLGVFVGDVKADVRGVLDQGCGTTFDEVKTRTFDANTKNPLELSCAVARLYIAQELAKLCAQVDIKGKRDHQQSSIQKYVDAKLKVDGPFKHYWDIIKKAKPLNLMKHASAFDDEKVPVELNNTQFTILVRLKEWLGRPDRPDDDVIKTVRDLENDRAAFIEAFTTVMKKLEAEAKSDTNANQTPNGAGGGLLMLRVISDKAVQHDLSWPDTQYPTAEELFDFAKIMAEESRSTSHKPPIPNPVPASAKAPKSTAGGAAAPGA
ncbi:hypothetical protein DdX_10525 [Ditylenchus destructor]|uniref:Uncharacterized protein n=1 Tax=Ditylenchus destructor TaxID=166010 RepID=A0AAD4N426_9BILA|nr:hypothetical protein DdX_10525 [Ditylenchus destructor]